MKGKCNIPIDFVREYHIEYILCEQFVMEMKGIQCVSSENFTHVTCQAYYELKSSVSFNETGSLVSSNLPLEIAMDEFRSKKSQ
jgi:hypothetical protein